jgi:hypothetical protein
LTLFAPTSFNPTLSIRQSVDVNWSVDANWSAMADLSAHGELSGRGGLSAHRDRSGYPDLSAYADLSVNEDMSAHEPLSAHEDLSALAFSLAFSESRHALLSAPAEQGSGSASGITTFVWAFIVGGVAVLVGIALVVFRCRRGKKGEYYYSEKSDSPEADGRTAFLKSEKNKLNDELSHIVCSNPITEDATIVYTTEMYIDDDLDDV